MSSSVVSWGLARLLVKIPAQEQLAALPRVFQQRLDLALQRLQEAPLEAGTALAHPFEGHWCLDVDRYRIIYKVLDEGRLVVVQAIRPRVATPDR